MNLKLLQRLPQGVRREAISQFNSVRAGVQLPDIAINIVKGMLLGVNAQRYNTPHNWGGKPLTAKEMETIIRYYWKWFDHVYRQYNW